MDTRAPASYSLLFQSIPVMVLSKFEMNVILQHFTSQWDGALSVGWVSSSQQLVTNYDTTEELSMFQRKLEFNQFQSHFRNK